MAAGNDATSLRAMLEGFADRNEKTLTSFLSDQKARDIERDTAFEALHLECRNSTEVLKAQIAGLESKINSTTEAADERFRTLEEKLKTLQVGPVQSPRISAGSHSFACERPAGFPGQGVQGYRAHIFLNSVIPSEKAETFIPTKLYLRGWAQFGEPSSGLQGDVVLPIMDALIQALPSGLQSRIIRCQCPYFRNWQGIFVLTEDTSSEQAWEISSRLNAKLKTDKAELHGRSLYVVVEAPQWKRERNASLMRAKRALTSYAPEIELHLHADWASGELWHKSSPILKIGSQPRVGSWKWIEDALKELKVDVSKLKDIHATSDF